MDDKIIKWNDLSIEMLKQIDAIEAIFGLDHTSPLATLLYNLHAELTKNLSIEIGDKDGMLEWYIWENDMGTRGFEAGMMGYTKAITNVHELIAVIKEFASV